MNITFATSSFVTYEGPVEISPVRKKRLKIISTLIPIISLGLIAGYIWGLGTLVDKIFSPKTGFIISILLTFSLMICLVIFGLYGVKKALASFKQNGKLIIDNTGFHIEQAETLFIPHENIEQIDFEPDRFEPRMPRVASGPIIKSFKVTFRYDHKIKTIFVEKVAEFGFRQAHGDLWETFQALRKTDHTLYQRIKYINDF